ncbi:MULTISPECIES: hypothetical protein [unclassified Streptomyces]|uniref:hypothetical protein n=1 Tax=unclassified Streptomyces TaxID=2593676 RepID=UPI002E2E3CD4|nr:hypothetical protein [Streptomyces sp. NBC_00223]
MRRIPATASYAAALPLSGCSRSTSSAASGASSAGRSAGALGTLVEHAMGKQVGS